MDILSTIRLDRIGDVADLFGGKQAFSLVQVRLTWSKAVDIDLHAFYKTKTGTKGHVYFGNKGQLDGPPYILLDKDAGVGNTAGKNEENLRIARIDQFATILIAVNIFRFLGFLSAGDNFAKYDGQVALRTDGGHNIEVPLTSEAKGRWCIIAKIDNTGATPKVINLNQVQKNEPGNESLSPG